MRRPLTCYFRSRPSKFKAVQKIATAEHNKDSHCTICPQPTLPPRPRAVLPNLASMKDIDPAIEDFTINMETEEEEHEQEQEQEQEQERGEEVPEKEEPGESKSKAEILARLRATSTLVPIGIHAIAKQEAPANPPPVPRRPV
jgi:hypothetical protein